MRTPYSASGLQKGPHLRPKLTLTLWAEVLSDSLEKT